MAAPKIFENIAITENFTLSYGFWFRKNKTETAEQ